MLILLPLLGVFFNGLTTAHVEANLSLEFKATKLLRQHNPGGDFPARYFAPHKVNNYDYYYNYDNNYPYDYDYDYDYDYVYNFETITTTPTVAIMMITITTMTIITTMITVTITATITRTITASIAVTITFMIEAKRDNAKSTGTAGGKNAKLDEVDNCILDILGNESTVVQGLGQPESDGVSSNLDSTLENREPQRATSSNKDNPKKRKVHTCEELKVQLLEIDFKSFRYFPSLQNGRHACSSLCPKEQLPAPEDTLSCRSPRLVEVPGHCCKMWLCENPTADVYATCHNASTSPWTPCSQPCGLGISTRFTSTNAGCRQLSNLRLCENRKCDQDNNNNNSKINKNYAIPLEESQLAQKATAIQQKQAHEQRHRQQQHQKQQLISHNAAAAAASNLVVSEPKDIKDSTNYNALFEHEEHRIRKGHECRNLQRLGPARIRLGACISRKLYRPKLCGLCHQHSGKCCVPSVSTTIQVELLCPLNANDPISFAEQQQKPDGQSPLQLWDTVSLEPIDQEFLQSHQIQIENKFIAVEWILKCECNKKENCNNLHKYSATIQSHIGGNNSSNSYNSKQENNNNNQDSSWHTSGYVDDHNNNKNAATNIISTITHNYNKNAYNNANNANTTGSGNDKRNMANSIGKQDNEQNIADDNGSDNRYVQQQQQQQQQEQQEIKEATEAEQEEQHLVSSSTSSELQPDIIPYPAMLPPRHNNRQQQQAEQNQKRPANGDKKNKNNDSSSSNWRGGEKSSTVSSDRGDGMRATIERDNNNNNKNNNKKGVESMVVSNENIFIADFGFYGHDSDEGDHNGDVDHSTGDDEKAKYYGSNEQQQQQQNALEEKQGDQVEQQHSQVEEWQVEKNLHYGYREQQLAAPVFGRAWQQYYTQDEQQQQQQKQKQQQYREQEHQHHQHHDHHTHLQHQQRYQHQHHQDHHHHHHHQHRHHQQHPHPHPPPPPPQPEHHFELEQQQESAITPHALPQRRT
ncbi:putative uncharacterized protein DDB_G0282129 [Rhagoletis pomonella]|uniref:putative uncharacterized protein DDB_G0282129 n=1 Tax=Rhagoletis pomonella TaxID=28610 RepID=UPI00177B2335|nr:putative uncharacterized protein DDB_G0282129 [Rhagoletis pomonella]